MMVVHVEQIRDDGLKLDEPLEQAFLAEALGQTGPETEFHVRGGTALRGTLQRLSGGVLLNGELTVPMVGPCHRCLGDVTLDVPVRFVLNLVPKSKAPEGDDEEGGDDKEADEQAGSFALPDADQEPFDGRTIHLAPIVREQVLLALPMTVFCREDCKGLCTKCGQDLNVQACNCDRHVPDPRLAALKNIKLS